MPKSSLFGKNLNLGEYYNRELILSKGEELSRYEGISYYISKVMYGQTEICELTSFRFPSFLQVRAKLESSAKIWRDVEGKKIVVEKNGEGGLSIYLADSNGARFSIIESGTKDVVDYANSTLKQYCSKVLI
ncbi:hypothetical protein GO685_00185 [Wolbachia endosymbiont of Madathamugadia hiepei]|uniref:hypothetical protein n=1 Tax=Wolbachia endosymbiont of Madathamugadia hiepei TaxID=1241303 RepID=UPI00158B5602|nr:hypothetical protein [Wolbachia endosymbiont of Madathamugadia hiepei]NUX00958.1 hypothetical protein [Wolbachia endosymbiont of Madathamugadia hiepei]